MKKKAKVKIPMAAKVEPVPPVPKSWWARHFGK
jgi:hypothetical protein